MTWKETCACNNASFFARAGWTCEFSMSERCCHGRRPHLSRDQHATSYNKHQKASFPSQQWDAIDATWGGRHDEGLRAELDVGGIDLCNGFH